LAKPRQQLVDWLPASCLVTRGCAGRCILSPVTMLAAKLCTALLGMPCSSKQAHTKAASPAAAHSHASLNCCVHQLTTTNWCSTSTKHTPARQQPATCAQRQQQASPGQHSSRQAVAVLYDNAATAHPPLARHHQATCNSNSSTTHIRSSKKQAHSLQAYAAQVARRTAQLNAPVSSCADTLLRAKPLPYCITFPQ
jgi:hypothetical protein